jgi:hypothetical protein
MDQYLNIDFVKIPYPPGLLQWPTAGLASLHKLLLGKWMQSSNPATISLSTPLLAAHDRR